MAFKFAPIQNKYFDQYQQLINCGTSGTSGLSPINTVFPQKYLSRVSNQQFMKAIANDMVMRNLIPTPTYSGSSAIMSIAEGTLIHDDTMIYLPEATNLDFDVAAYGDTPTTGSHLCIFSDFKYIETPDVDDQTDFRLTIYHVNSTGMTVNGSPTFDLDRNKVLIGVISFTKDISNNITEIGIDPVPLLSVMGEVFQVGAGYFNLVLYDLLSAMTGYHGTSSYSGVSGISRTSGLSRSSGSSGTSGNSGSSGTSGTSGSSGTSGTSMPSGTSGTSVTEGTSGGSLPSGSSGSSGVSGSSGSSGTSGTSGTSMPSGTSGTSMPSGTSGTSRLSGTSGTSLVSGSSGTSGTEIDINVVDEILFLNF